MYKDVLVIEKFFGEDANYKYNNIASNYLYKEFRG